MADLPAADPRTATPARLRQDQKVERFIGVLLETGVLLSILVVLIGMTLYLGRAGQQVADFQVFRTYVVVTLIVLVVLLSGLFGVGP